MTVRALQIVFAGLPRIPTLVGRVELVVTSPPYGSSTMQVLRRSGRRIPDDVAVGGYDDSRGSQRGAWADHRPPALSAHRRRSDPDATVLPNDLVIREFT